MPALINFNSVVAARTRAAEQILHDKALLAIYLDQGGLKDELVEIRDLGLRAEALNGAQSAAQAAGGAATTDVVDAFASVQREYTAVMAVVQAVRHALARGKASQELLSALDKILVNEAEVAVRSIPDGVDANGQPAKKKVMRRKVTQEALRAEIAKDAAALVALKPAHTALARRKVDVKRLQRLKTDAEALAGKLAQRSTAKGAAKSATSSEHDVVTEQKQVWGAHYRILAAVGRKDHRIAALLTEAARKR